MIVFPTPVIGRGKADVIPIIDDFEGTWTGPDIEPPNWSRSAGSIGGLTKVTASPFSGSLSWRAVSTYDGDVSYYLMTWTRAAFSLSGHNRMKIRKCRGSNGSDSLTTDQTIKLNGVALTSGLVLSSVNTGVNGPTGNKWYEYVVDISGVGGSLVLVVESASTDPNRWPYFDKIELYGE